MNHSLIIATSILSIRLIHWLFYAVKSFMKLYKTSPNDDKAFYMSAIWMKTLRGHLYIAEDFLA